MALSADRVRRFYDRLGRLQDTQAFYEDAAIDDLIAHSDLEHAHRAGIVPPNFARISVSASCPGRTRGGPGTPSDQHFYPKKGRAAWAAPETP